MWFCEALGIIQQTSEIPKILEIRFPNHFFLASLFVTAFFFAGVFLGLGFFTSTNLTKFSTSQPITTASTASPAFTSTTESPRTAARLRTGAASNLVDFGAALSKCIVATLLGLPVARPASVMPLGKVPEDHTAAITSLHGDVAGRDAFGFAIR